MSYAIALTDVRLWPVDQVTHRYLTTEATREDAHAVAAAANELHSPSRAVVLEVVPPGDVGAGEYVTLVTDAGENIVCRV